MRAASGWRAGVLTAAIGLALPAAAHATSYCVHQGISPCQVSQVDKGSDLQAALTAAQAGDGNTVTVGPGTYSATNGFSYTDSTHVVTITGAGVGSTILQAGVTATYVVALQAKAGSSLTGMTLAPAGPLQNGLQLNGAEAAHLEIDAYDAQVSGAIVQNASLTDSLVVGNSVDYQHGIVELHSQGALLRDQINGSNVAVFVNGLDTTIRDSRIAYGGYGVNATGTGSAVTLDDDLLDQFGSSPVGLRVTDGATLTARSTTIYTGSSIGGTGVSVTAASGTFPAATVQDSIVWGAGTSVFRGGAGSSSLTLGHDDIVLPADSGTAGTFTPGAGNIDTDPMFVDATHHDFDLLAGSHAIDAGSGCQTLCTTLPDLAGLNRPIDGDGDGTAVRDMGAYEYGHRAPSVGIPTADPKSAPTGQPMTFAASGTDPDPGDTLTYAWTFGDGTNATGASVQHAFATAGTHTVSVTATDPTGQTATKTLDVTVTQAPPVTTTTTTSTTPAPTTTSTGASTTPSPVVKDTTPPALGSLALSPARFGVSTATTAVSAKKRSIPKGTTISFSLSEVATVKLAIDRATTSASCVKRAKAKHRSTKSCTTYHREGTLARANLAARIDKVPFSGRIGRRALGTGAYRLTATATDAAGNTGPAKTATFTIARP